MKMNRRDRSVAKVFRSTVVVSLAVASTAAFFVDQAHATRRYDPMSLKPGSTSIGQPADPAGTVNAADIYAERIAPSPLGNPMIDVPATDIGITTADNLLDFSAGETDPAGSVFVYFSVANGSSLGPGTGADVYVTEASGSALDAIAGTPASATPFVQSIDSSLYNFEDSDDNDGFEISQFNNSGLPPRVLPVYFTYEDGSLQTGLQIFVTDNGTTSEAAFLDASSTPAHTLMGLVDGDVIDGLAVWDLNDDGVVDPGSDLIAFSLRTGSPSLGTGSGADIYVSDFGGDFELWLSAASLGLDDTDEIDALDVSNSLIIRIPEPSAVGLLAVSAIAMLRRRSR